MLEQLRQMAHLQSASGRTAKSRSQLAGNPSRRAGGRVTRRPCLWRRAIASYTQEVGISRAYGLPTGSIALNFQPVEFESHSFTAWKADKDKAARRARWRRSDRSPTMWTYCGPKLERLLADTSTGPASVIPNNALIYWSFFVAAAGLEPALRMVPEADFKSAVSTVPPRGRGSICITQGR
jgi:hypothetical protein